MCLLLLSVNIWNEDKVTRVDLSKFEGRFSKCSFCTICIHELFSCYCGLFLMVCIHSFLIDLWCFIRTLIYVFRVVKNDIISCTTNDALGSSCSSAEVFMS